MLDALDPNIFLQLPIVGVFVWVVFKMLHLARDERQEVRESLVSSIEKNTDTLVGLDKTMTETTTLIVAELKQRRA